MNTSVRPNNVPADKWTRHLLNIIL